MCKWGISSHSDDSAAFLLDTAVGSRNDDGAADGVFCWLGRHEHLTSEILRSTRDAGDSTVSCDMKEARSRLLLAQGCHLLFMESEDMVMTQRSS